MPDPSDSHEQAESPVVWTRTVIRRAWNDLVSVYYANTLIWRLLKSAALVFFGFFLWSSANLLLSYQAGWNVLHYVMAYGFAVIFWGPFTHFVVVPVVIRMRRSGKGGIRRQFARHGSKINLTVFLLVVVVLGTAVPGVMTFEFQVPAGGDGGGDVNPQLQCTRSGDVVHCHLSDSRGIDHVVVSSGGERLQTIEEPPFEFNVNVEDTEAVNGDKQFTVELRDENGDTVRKYIRRVDLIPG